MKTESTATKETNGDDDDDPDTDNVGEACFQES